MTLRLLAIHAHPDDESSKGAATSAYYASRGARVIVVSCTGGERGSVLNEQLGDQARAQAERDMGGLRREEMRAAQEALGIEHRWLGYEDSGLPGPDEPLPPGSFATVPVELSAEPLVRLVREVRPHVIVSYDENGGYPHPDHIRTHEVAMAAWNLSGDSGAYPEAGEPWEIKKFYYDRAFNPSRARAVYDLMLEREPDSPLTSELHRIIEWIGERVDTATTRVPCGEFFEARDAALRAHASQVSPESPFFFWPNHLLREAWPTEDYELAHSRVHSDLPESDLFAGIDDEEEQA
ncbi:mycothiol conjugate amidase Mca [Ruicaihuangia caeni]|uniref:Mycothiol S-conjugate amidase n=1 Tax=Ruicaihuangia caeni TaxID=3042517 RepID=A0AAW6T6Q0_9MICO|nr:mycothiol conjugate amidase Mca [Klugiella sp. YN-L-19]MDI2099500.1 mycothiol conjugate amidase Mca [Klugiella sp. YN-L-19]